MPPLQHRQGPPRGRDSRNRPRSRGLLHPLEDLLALSQAPQAGQETSSSSAQRRQRQRLALAQRLLDPLPTALVAPEAAGDRFWTVLRWGGLGLILARVLQL
jgi:hypothetical protein